MVKPTKKSRKESPALPIGIFLLFLTPVFYFATGSLVGASCPVTEYGACEMGYAISSSITVMYLTAAWAILGISVTVYGLYARIKNQKK